MQWFVDLIIWFFENLHIIALVFTFFSLIYCIYIVKIEIKARYYLAIKDRIKELENKKSK